MIPRRVSPVTVFNILCIGQAGRLQYEAVLLAASLRARSPGFPGRLLIATPRPGPLWGAENPQITDPATLDLLADLGAEIIPFDSRAFGARYPHGNKIEALAHIPDAPFLFLDTDTIITGDIATLAPDFTRPTASMKREGTWPQIELYGPGYTEIWRSLYHRFGLDFETSLDRSQPDDYWQRYLYFNAGWFLHDSPRRFGALFLKYATEIAADPGPALVCQSLDPWLDQVALPLVIHALGGGRPGPDLAGLDGALTCHWRILPLFFARESDHAVAVMEQIAADPRVERVLRAYAPFRKMLYKGQGREVRALFDRADLPRKEQAIRNAIKRAGLWTR
ncbi:hypothetical protein GU920_01945 [Rhodobacter sp. CCP-1]|uniref:Uncharacterized protein n=1 Tax=Paragemmobacter ruber TaxID=1985673 RepID=A0ABW9Y1C2_9RHOB|nr:hypothetical protein [Rhodobacter ruber]